MDTNTILYITLALLVALGFSFLQYLFRKRPRSSKDYIFFGLRSISIFIILLLIINPKIVSTQFVLVKPNLIVLADNSESIKFLNSSKDELALIDKIFSSEDLKKNFEILRVPFSDGILSSDSLEFEHGQSNINRALMEVEDVYSETPNAIVLLTDANQNIGRDFRYYKAREKDKLFPVLLGDTTKFKDLRIDQINVNRYAFLNNKFPVEVFLGYSGKEDVNAILKVKSNNNVISSQTVQFSNDQKSQIINLELPASSIGLKHYQVEISTLPEEKNINNNLSRFAIEVLDERSKVLILTKILHPDLGAIKNAIESNEQRSAEIKYLNDDFELEDYQLIILYQPDQRFKKVWENMRKRSNFLIVSGSKTNWSYLNSLNLGLQRQITGDLQEVFPVINTNFSSFHFDNFQIDKLPPLVDHFGTIEAEKGKFDVLLFQEIQGVNSMDPLISITRGQPKYGFILGENIWRWRSQVYKENTAFNKFDEFFGKLVQNLSAGDNRERLRLKTENFYNENQEIILKAEYFDQNYEFDSGEELLLTVKDSSGVKVITSTMVPKNNIYELGLRDLGAGRYTFSIKANDAGILKNGSFEVIDYKVEQQQNSSNLKAMEHFAQLNNSTIYFPTQFDILKNQLLENKALRPVQKSHQKTVPLIDWYYLLFILISTLSAEWFYRKYLGLI